MSFFQVKKLKKQTNNKMINIKNTLNKKKIRGAWATHSPNL